MFFLLEFAKQISRDFVVLIDERKVCYKEFW